jgi:hypothetical protein
MAVEVDVVATGSQWGVVRGFVKRAAGQPAPDCGIWGEPDAPPAAAIPDILYLTGEDGCYQFELPAGTYTIKVNGTSMSGMPVSAEVAGVVVTGGSSTSVDITVAEQQN